VQRWAADSIPSEQALEAELRPLRAPVVGLKRCTCHWAGTTTYGPSGRVGSHIRHAVGCDCASAGAAESASHDAADCGAAESASTGAAENANENLAMTPNTSKQKPHTINDHAATTQHAL
jgi:hypothetical protein